MWYFDFYIYIDYYCGGCGPFKGPLEDPIIKWQKQIYNWDIEKYDLSEKKMQNKRGIIIL